MTTPDLHFEIWKLEHSEMKTQRAIGRHMREVMLSRLDERPSAREGQPTRRSRFISAAIQSLRMRFGRTSFSQPR